MPYIEARVTTKLTDEKKNEVKAEFGRLMTILNKSEAYLMVGIEDNYDLWMGGSKLEKGAYVSVSLLGNAPSQKYNEMTAAVCEFFESRLDIPGSAVYITYHPVSDWGWNGANF